MLIIFDVDGTLLDSWNWMASELVENAARFGYRHVVRAEVDRLRRLETQDVLAALKVPPDRTACLVAHLRESAEAKAASMRVFDGVLELLAELRGIGDQLALVSSNSEKAIQTSLGREIYGMFRVRRCNTGLFDKAAEFDAILKQSGVEALSALAIGDETRDIEAAAQAGIGMIAVEWGYAEAKLLREKAPGRTAASIAQLTDMIAARREQTA